MFRPAYPLQTARLTVRPFSPDDLDDLYAYHSLPAVARYLYWDARSLDEVRQVLKTKIRQDALGAEGDVLALAVWSREAGRVVGEISLFWRSRTNRQGEIGFVFNPAYHGQGLAREAAELGLGLGFDGLGLHRMIGRCDTRNHPSARLMDRLGMRREACFIQNEVFKGEWADEYVYAMLEDEWRARAGRNGSDPGTAGTGTGTAPG